MHITFKNEGISQLINYIHDHNYPFYSAFMCIHNSSSVSSELFQKLDNMHIELKGNNWKTAIEQGIAIHDHLYAPTLDAHETIQPYTIEYNELLLYFQ